MVYERALLDRRVASLLAMTGYGGAPRGEGYGGTPRGEGYGGAPRGDGYGCASHDTGPPDLCQSDQRHRSNLGPP